MNKEIRNENSFVIEYVKYNFIDRHNDGVYKHGICYSKPYDLHYAEVVGIIPNASKEYVIRNTVEHPETHHKYSVSCIVNRAFENASVKKMYIEDNLYIYEGAFLNCEGLLEVRLPQDCKRLPSEMFSGCISIKHIELPEQLETIESFCFYKCSSIRIINIPSCVYRICFKAFCGCVNLEKVIINGKPSMNDECFVDCVNLKNINVSTDYNLYQIDFIGCSNLPKQIRNKLIQTDRAKDVICQRRKGKWWYKLVRIIIEPVLWIVALLILAILAILVIALLGIIMPVVQSFYLLIIAGAFVCIIIFFIYIFLRTLMGK